MSEQKASDLLTALYAPKLSEADFMLYLVSKNAAEYNQPRLAEYIWIDGYGQLRSKTRVIPNLDSIIRNKGLPLVWNFDGSSTNQAQGHDSEIELRPVYSCWDPMNGYDLLVLCACYLPNGEPALNNHYEFAKQIFDKISDEKSDTELCSEPWYGIEQEYTIMKPDHKTPIGWPDDSTEPSSQGPYYCGVGAGRCFGRKLADLHLRLCLIAGLKMSGKNAEVMPGQWEYQVGPCQGIEAAHQLWMSRYILLRVAETLGFIISFDPKPMVGDWNGSGLHTNFSTKATRAPNGLTEIGRILDNLRLNHAQDMLVYGSNDKRLTGQHETSTMDEFTSGIADRGASVRIPRQTVKDNCGYFEDRRPASDADPYLVTSSLVVNTMSFNSNSD